MEEEIFAWGLASHDEVSNIGYEVLRKKIKEAVEKKWITANQGKELLENKKSTFQTRIKSDALFYFRSSTNIY
jgi:hypothetical protein